MIDFKRHWYALYTKSRNEKKVALLLQESGIESYLPLVKTLRSWSDRRKMVLEPLFRSYVFVNVNDLNCNFALKVPGVVRYVSFGGRKIMIPDIQIDIVKTYLGERDISEPLGYFQTGNFVEVVYGSLCGLRGELVSARNYKKLIIRIDAVRQNILLTVPSHLLKKIERSSA